MIRIEFVVNVALLLTLGSAGLERRGPDYQLACAMGRSADGLDITCPRPVLNGGWPAAFPVGRFGVSVEGKLSFIEDEMRWEPLLATAAFWLLVSAVTAFVARRLSRGRGPKHSG